MLWKVAGTNLHLLGSIHTADSTVSLGLEASRRIDEASTVAFEVKPGIDPNLSKGFFRHGVKLSSVISDGLFTATQALWARLQIDGDLESHRPWLAGLVVVNNLKREWGYNDAHSVELLVSAKCSGKSLFYLEQVNAALDAFAGAPPIEQEEFLSGAVQRLEEGRDTLATICAAWRADRPDDLMPIVRKQLAQTPKLQGAVIGARNRAWLRHLERFARASTPTVAVVGALHFVGPASIPELLAKRGFRCDFIGNSADEGSTA